MLDPSEESISVSIRVRPLNERELKQNQYASWKVDPKENTIAQLDQEMRMIKTSSFTFDQVFDDGNNTDDIYTSVAQSVIQSALQGVNGTIFAYGQTSSGKTYSMSGIIKRAVDEIFDHIQNCEERQFRVQMSYMEIYNEVIKDLMNPDSGTLKVHEDLRKGIYVGGLTEIEVHQEEVFQKLQDTERNRTVGKTAMNSESSRSHSILRIIISSELKEKDEEFGSKGLRACLNLVDLAGSERCSQTKSQGIRLKEGGHINKSLLTLGTVIRKLSEGSGSHIPYRDSKLTRILQTALGGSSRTAILCCVTPASMHTDETLSTLKFASRAKNIKNKIEINEIVDDATLIRRLKQENAQLKRRLNCVKIVEVRGRRKKSRKRKALIQEDAELGSPPVTNRMPLGDISGNTDHRTPSQQKKLFNKMNEKDDIKSTPSSVDFGLLSSTDSNCSSPMSEALLGVTTVEKGKIDQLRVCLELSQKKLASLQDMCDNLESKNYDVKQLLLKEQNNYKHQIDELEISLRDWHFKEETWAKSTEEVKAIASELQSCLDDMRADTSRKDSQIIELKEKLRVSRETALNEKADLRNRIESLVGKNADAEEQVRLQRESLIELEAEQKRMQKCAAEDKEKINYITQELEIEKKDRAKLEEENEKQSHRIDELQAEISSQKICSDEKVSSLVESDTFTLVSCDGSISSKEDEEEVEKKTNLLLTSLLETEKKNRCSIEKELAEQQSANQEFITRLSQLQTTYDHSKEEASTLKLHLNELSLKFKNEETLKAEAVESLTKLEKKNKDLEGKLEHVEAILEQKEESLQSLTFELGNLEEDRKDIEEEKEKVSEELEAVRLKLASIRRNEKEQNKEEQVNALTKNEQEKQLQVVNHDEENKVGEKSRVPEQCQTEVLTISNEEMSESLQKEIDARQNLQKVLDENIAKLSDLQDALEKSNAKADLISREKQAAAEDMKDAISRKIEENKRVESELSRVMSELESYKRQESELKGKIEIFENQQRQKDDFTKEAQVAMENTIEELEESLTREKSTFEDKLKAVKDQLVTEVNNNKELQLKKDSLEAKLVNIQKALQPLHTSIASNDVSLTLSSMLKEKEILESKLAQALDSMNKMGSKEVEIKAKISGLESCVDTAAIKQQMLQNNVDSLAAEKQSLESQIRDKDSQIQELASKVQLLDRINAEGQAKNEQIEKLKNRMKAFKDKYMLVNNGLKEAQQALHAHTNQAKILKSENKELIERVRQQKSEIRNLGKLVPTEKMKLQIVKSVRKQRDAMVVKKLAKITGMSEEECKAMCAGMKD